uniref:Uncharacterized protein n=1 Tax=Arundo donax TaxID=35708 RepID=A0A0A9DJC6_ARUDO
MCPWGTNDFPMTNSTHIEVHHIICFVLHLQGFLNFLMESLTSFSSCSNNVGRFVKRSDVI